MLKAEINLSTEHGQEAIEPLLSGIDLLILDNLSTLLTSRSETASDTWFQIQTWLLKLRRRTSVLLVRHAEPTGGNEARLGEKMLWIRW